MSKEKKSSVTLVSFPLDQDERDVLDCLIERSLIKQKIIKYAQYHGHDLKDVPFEYDKEFGTVKYFKKEK